MKVYHADAEQAYHPRHSFFYGRFTPCPDVPARTRAILEALAGRPGVTVEAPPPCGRGLLERAHGRGYLETLETVCGRLEPGEEFFPFHMRPLPLLLASPHARLRMGYYALDGSTPLLRESFAAALGGAAAAAAGAQALADGAPAAYSLPRPPGHHAGRESYAGFCLLNNAALAAEVLGALGRVAILDVDYHHGNGSQDIFWRREDVLYVSLHCRPEEAYPYVAGAADERGGGPGRGANLNLPLPGGTDWAAYAPALETALEAVARFGPATVIVSLGFDTLGTDPIGSFALRPEDFAPLGRRVAQLGRPLLVLQEGGYDVDALGACAVAFLEGLGALPAAAGREARA